MFSWHGAGCFGSIKKKREREIGYFSCWLFFNLWAVWCYLLLSELIMLLLFSTPTYLLPNNLHLLMPLLRISDTDILQCQIGMQIAALCFSLGFRYCFGLPGFERLTANCGANSTRRQAPSCPRAQNLVCWHLTEVLARRWAPYVLPSSLNKCCSGQREYSLDSSLPSYFK